MTVSPLTGAKRKASFGTRAIRDIKKNHYKYLIVLPVLAYFILFHYKPMYGVLIAFKNYRPSLGIWGSPWAGLEHFRAFFTDIYFFRILRNTFLISLYSILWGFPVPIIFALLLNELRSNAYKRVVQTVSYMPHFISMVVVCGLIVNFSQVNGLFNTIIEFFGGTRTNLIGQKSAFRTLFVASGVWQSFGWNSIIYLAALSGIDPQQYEAAQIDGANRFRQAVHVTIPGILPTIVMLLILRMGSILSGGGEKVLLLYKPITYEVSDMISTYVYRKGIEDASYSFSTAVNMFNSVINIIFLLAANAISKRASEISLF